jgi:hypothetical protein
MHQDFNFLKKQTRTPTAARQTVALLQSNCSSFVLKFKAAFFFGILPTTFTKEAPWSQKNTTQHNTLQIPGHKTSKFGSKNREKFHRTKKFINFFPKEADRSNNRNSATDFILILQTFLQQ